MLPGVKSSSLIESNLGQYEHNRPGVEVIEEKEKRPSENTKHISKTSAKKQGTALRKVAFI